MRVFVLYNAEFLSDAAQSALRRTMETRASKVKIFFVVQDASRLMAPIQGRCQKFILQSPSDTEIFGILQHVVQQEHLFTYVDKRYEANWDVNLINDIVSFCKIALLTGLKSKMIKL